MHLFLTNDDGIFANGLRALVGAALRAGHRVSVFAPDSQRSAASHAITLDRPLHARRVEMPGARAWAVDGTPADCARLGLYILRDDLPDVVVSGVNNGANRGAGVMYSGTVGAALEGALCGRQGVAVSLCGNLDRDFELAAALGVRTAEWAAAHPLPRGEIYSLNVPYGARIRGLRAARLSNEYISTPQYVETDGAYHLGQGTDVPPETDDMSDLLLTRAGFATLSIVGWNMLAATELPPLGELEAEFQRDAKPD